MRSMNRLIAEPCHPLGEPAGLKFLSEFRVDSISRSNTSVEGLSRKIVKDSGTKIIRTADGVIHVAIYHSLLKYNRCTKPLLSCEHLMGRP